MTTPTQAQIVAAAKVLNASYENMAYSRKIAKAALTAAAEVGKQNSDWIAKRAAIRDTAIERCAQVAEGWNRREGDVLLIAAAIRKLKNKS